MWCEKALRASRRALGVPPSGGCGPRKRGTPNGHFADAAADEIGDGDLRGGMEVAGERIALPRAQQGLHIGRGVGVAVFLSIVAGGKFNEKDLFDNHGMAPKMPESQNILSV